jgi:pimeloyl-ACP methyl ester carboxylesterase
VDGREQAIDCVGEGSPTVILEPGLGVPSRMFLTVMSDLSDAGVRVCRYDRAGMEASDRSADPRTAQAMVDELRSLLVAAGEQPPYVLVGHSFGGLIIQLFAREHPDEVVGAVFVDAIHPDLDKKIEPMLSKAQVTLRRDELALNDEGIVFDDILTSEDQVRDAPPFPAIPIVVLRHGIPFDTTDPDWPAQKVEDLWTALEEDLATLSATSELVVAPNSQHRIMVTEPQLVADAIERVLAMAGQGGAPGG